MERPTLSTYEIIRRLLAEGHEPTLSEFAEETGKTKRTVRRNIRKIREQEGIDVQEYRDDDTGEKRFAFSDDHHLVDSDSNLDLGAEELRALQISAMAAKTVLVPTPFADALDNALDKITDRLSGIESITSFEFARQDKQWHFDLGRQSTFESAVFEIVMQALDNEKKLRIDYYSASSDRRSTDRVIRPYTIAMRGGSWLLIAYCEQSGEDRTFALGGIEGAELAGPAGSYNSSGDYESEDPDSFDADAYFENAFGALTNGEQKYVTLAVAPDKVSSFKRKKYHPTQDVLENANDAGEAFVTYKVAGLEGITSFVRAWGPHVRVVDPEDLRERIQNEAAQVAEMYEEEE